jgi:pyridoxamine 5'-phosphate oxidase
MEDLSNYRKSYDKSELLETSIPEDPINLLIVGFTKLRTLEVVKKLML